LSAPCAAGEKREAVRFSRFANVRQNGPVFAKHWQKTGLRGKLVGDYGKTGHFLFFFNARLGGFQWLSMSHFRGKRLTPRRRGGHRDIFPHFLLLPSLLLT
jgi:hypothetical protein